RQPLDRRRGAGSLGGSRLPRRRQARQAGELRLEPLRGPLRLFREPPLRERRRQGTTGDRVLARPRLLDHRRLCLSRLRGAGCPRPVLLRRLLRGHSLELPRRCARPFLRRGRLRTGTDALVVRRGRTWRAVRHLPRRHALPASPGMTASRLASSVVAFALAGLLVAACGSSGAAGGVAGARKTIATTGHDWTRFGWDAQRSNDDPFPTAITAANVKSLHRRQVRLPG